MIGDITKVRDSYGGEHEEYGNYFGDGCHPNLSAVKGVVRSVEAKLSSHLERQALGTPMLQPLSPADVMDRITVNQGYFAQGPKETAFDGTIAAIRQMSATRTVQAPAQSEKVKSVIQHMQSKDNGSSKLGNAHPDTDKMSAILAENEALKIKLASFLQQFGDSPIEEGPALCDLWVPSEKIRSAANPLRDSPL